MADKIQSESKTQIRDLDVDCLRYIFNKLAKVDYWRMRRVCPCFNYIVTRFPCPPHYKDWSDSGADGDSGDFKFLLDCMSDVAEQVTAQNITEDDIELLGERNLVFSNVHTLKVHIPFKFVKIEEIIARTFPNVVRLHYTGVLRDGSEFGNLTELKEFEFSNCSAFPDNIFTMCQRSQLTAITIISTNGNQRCENDFRGGIRMCANTLEEIAVSKAVFPCLTELLETPMPRLQRFALIDTNHDFFTENSLSSLVERIYQFHSNFFTAYIDNLSILRNLEQLVISGEDIFCRNIQRLHEYFPYLTEIQCWNLETEFRISDNGANERDETLTILTSFNQNLKILSIPIEWIGDRFELSDLLNVLREQHNRTVPLELRCYVSKSIGNDERFEMLQNLNVNGNEQLLQVSLHDYPERWEHWNDSEIRKFFEIHLKCLNTN